MLGHTLGMEALVVVEVIAALGDLAVVDLEDLADQVEAAGQAEAAASLVVGPLVTGNNNFLE